MEQKTFIEKQEENISVHIFSVSAAMIGVCLTAIGIVDIISSLEKITTLVDETIALNALFFLGTCLLSYVAIKTSDRKRRLVLERVADGFFLTGLTSMGFVCVYIVYRLL